MFEFSQRRQNLQEESFLGRVGEPAPISEWAAESMVSYETTLDANCGLLGLSSVSDHRKKNKNETKLWDEHAAEIGLLRKDIDYGENVSWLKMKDYRFSRKRKKKIWRKRHKRKPSSLEQKGSAHPQLRDSQAKVNSVCNENFSVSLGVAKQRKRTGRKVISTSKSTGALYLSWKDKETVSKENLVSPENRCFSHGDAKRNAEGRGKFVCCSINGSPQYEGFLMTLESSLEDINAKERKLTEEMEKLRRIKKAQQERTRKQVQRNSSKRKNQSFDALGKDEDEEVDAKEKQAQNSEEGRNYRARMSIVSNSILTHSAKASQQSRSNQFEVLSEENERERQYKPRQSLMEKQTKGGQLEAARMEAKGKSRRERVSFVNMNETGEDEIEEPMTGFDQEEDEDPLFLQEVVGTAQRNTYIKDWKDNWVFPEGLDPAKEGRTNLRRFEYKCKPLAEILQRCQIFNKPTHERWTHLKYAFYMVRNMAALEYRIMRNDTEGVLIPNYVLDALSNNLQTVIGGKYYWKYCRALYRKISNENPQAIYGGPFDEDNKMMVKVTPKVDAMETFLDVLTRRMFSLEEMFTCSLEEVKKLETILVMSEKKHVRQRAAKIYAKAKEKVNPSTKERMEFPGEKE